MTCSPLTGKIVGVYDKGKGVTVVIEATTEDQDGTVICINRFTVFIRGIGGYGGDRGPTPAKLSPPEGKKPCAVVSEKTSDNQALLYRLGSGDLNPLHADPSMAAMGGFDKPILHGMCSFGHAARAVLKSFCGNDPARFKSIQARMTKHVFPGETLRTEMWKVSATQVRFRCISEDRNVVVLANAAVEIVPDAPGAAAQPTSAPPSAANDGFLSTPIFMMLKARLAEQGKEAVDKVGGIFAFKITGGPGGAGKTWTVDVKNGSGSVSPVSPPKADLTITLTDADCHALFTGQLNPQQAFMSGKLKISGNMAMAMKLDVLMKTEKSKL